MLLALIVACSSTPPPTGGGGGGGGASNPLGGARQAAPEAPAHRRGPPNVLLVILDDVGTDKVAAYGEEKKAPETPTLTALAHEGMLFRNAWATPYCSSTRAAIQTGRQPGRTGIGYVVFPEQDAWELAPSEVTLPEMLERAPTKWDSSLVGKWHLGTRKSGSPATHPGRQGYAWWASTDDNLGAGPTAYYSFERNLNGTESTVNAYATTVQADDALARTKAMAEPWLITLAFNAAHAPLHAPPPELAPLPPGATQADKFDAMLVAADRELGRVLAGMDPAVRERTMIFVIGDNGTMEQGVRPPRDPAAAKGTVYEGGVNVPLIVAGPLVGKPGAESLALVHAVDLFATVADIANVDLKGLPNPIDGRSLLPALKDPSADVHRLLFTEQFQPNGRPGDWKMHARAVRGARYKLVLLTKAGQTTEHLYDLQGRDVDGPDLLAGGGKLSEEAREALAQLRTELERHEPEPGREKEGGPAKGKRRKG